MLPRMAIRDWPRSNGRAKSCWKGAGALSDAELLAILLRNGTAGHSALDLARSILGHFGSLRHLVAADRARFCAEPGLGSPDMPRFRPPRRFAATAVGAAARRAAARQPQGHPRVSERPAAPSGARSFCCSTSTSVTD